VPTIFELPDHLMPKVKKRRILRQSDEIQVRMIFNILIIYYVIIFFYWILNIIYK